MNRHEIKYPLQAFEKVQKTLSSLQMVPAYTQRKVNSIYFETSNFQFYHESNEGIVPRKKIRLRWYDQSNPLLAGALETKWSKPHYREKIVKKYTFAIAQTAKQLLNMVDNRMLKPILLVSYDRRYYHNAQGIRATWDENISYQKICPQMKSRGNICTDPIQVFEIKADPGVDKDKLMGKVALSPQRFSKYCRGIEQTGLYMEG